MAGTAATETQSGIVTRALGRLVDVRADEVRAMLLASAYFFFILTSYYILRPIRDEAGVAGGVANLPWMFTGTLVGMLLANPIFSALVARYPRRRFIPITYRFFALNLLLFFALLHMVPANRTVWLGRAFYVWVSVFNLFVVSVFWGFMADLFRSEQGKRLFGFIGVGGTLGAILGSSITALLAQWLTPRNLLLVAMLFLEVAVQVALALERMVRRRAEGQPARGAGPASLDAAPGEAGSVPVSTAKGGREQVIGGNAWAGISHVMKSPYLLGICLFMLLFTIGSTFLYIQQAALVDATSLDRAARTALFAKIDLMVNTLTLLVQAFLTGRLLKWLGVPVTLALIPAVSVAGFLALGLMPTLAVVVAFQVLRRAGNFAVARPSREVLFTVIPREDKYKAKSLIDTFVYRGGDQIGAWSWKLLSVFGLGVSGVAFVAAPVSGLWLMISVWLGRRQNRMARAQEAADTARAEEPAIA